MIPDPRLQHANCPFINRCHIGIKEALLMPQSLNERLIDFIEVRIISLINLSEAFKEAFDFGYVIHIVIYFAS